MLATNSVGHDCSVIENNIFWIFGVVWEVDSREILWYSHWRGLPAGGRAWPDFCLRLSEHQGPWRAPSVLPWSGASRGYSHYPGAGSTLQQSWTGPTENKISLKSTLPIQLRNNTVWWHNNCDCKIQICSSTYWWSSKGWNPEVRFFPWEYLHEIEFLRCFWDLTLWEWPHLDCAKLDFFIRVIVYDCHEVVADVHLLWVASWISVPIGHQCSHMEDNWRNHTYHKIYDHIPRGRNHTKGVGFDTKRNPHHFSHHWDIKTTLIAGFTGSSQKEWLWVWLDGMGKVAITNMVTMIIGAQAILRQIIICHESPTSSCVFQSAWHLQTSMKFWFTTRVICPQFSPSYHQ